VTVGSDPAKYDGLEPKNTKAHVNEGLMDSLRGTSFVIGCARRWAHLLSVVTRTGWSCRGTLERSEGQAGVAACGGRCRARADGPCVWVELGLTLLIIEHDIPLIMGISDRIVAMADGQVIATGTPGEVRTNPRVVEADLGGSIADIERSGGASATRELVRGVAAR